MSFTEIRPRFKRSTQLQEAEILTCIQTTLEAKQPRVEFRSAHGWIYLSIPEEDQHIWSPRLSVEIDPGKEHNVLHATFGPNPNVWTLFVFIYSFLGFAAMVIFIIGGSRMSLGLSGSILWLIPVLLILVAMVYFSARTGQNLAKDQMWLLYEFFHQSLEDQIDLIDEK